MMNKKDNVENEISNDISMEDDSQMGAEDSQNGGQNPEQASPESGQESPQISKSPQKKESRVKKALLLLGKRYFITSFSGMAIGLFCTLIAGTILQTLADIFRGWADPVASFLFTLGYFAKIMMGAGIGAGIAFDLKANKLTMASAVAAGFIGAFANSFYNLPGEIAPAAISFGASGLPGNPINSFLCAVAAIELGRLVSGKTKVDILIVPMCCLLGAGLVAFTLGRPVDFLIGKISDGIELAMDVQPFLMSILISVSMGLLLTLPTSSAAIGFSAGLSGIAAGAAVAGCCAHMIGFAVMSFRENKWGGLISQGLGTSMLQIPNIAKKPLLLIPPVVASAITGPLAVLLFKLECDAAGSGMGTAGLVGVIQTVKVSLDANVNTALLISGVAVCLFVLPALICFGLSELMRKRGWIKFGDLKIN